LAGARIDGGQQAAGLRDVGPNQLQRDRARAISPASQIREQNLGFQRRKNVAILPICNKTKREKLSAMWATPSGARARGTPTKEGGYARMNASSRKRLVLPLVSLMAVFAVSAQAQEHRGEAAPGAAARRPWGCSKVARASVRTAGQGGRRTLRPWGDRSSGFWWPSLSRAPRLGRRALAS
jgi:hypothetical protein